MAHDLNDKSQDETDTPEARRQALKRFGRYAAAATPAVIMLLGAPASQAGWRGGWGRGGGHGRGHGGYH